MSAPKDIEIIIAAEEYAEGKPNAMALSLAFKMGIAWYREKVNVPQEMKLKDFVDKFTCN